MVFKEYKMFSIVLQYYAMNMHAYYLPGSSNCTMLYCSIRMFVIRAYHYIVLFNEIHAC